MFREIFRLALANQKPMQWPTFDGLELDRTEFLTSSEVAGCLRQAFFKKNPDKYPPKVTGNGPGGENGYTERGHAIESWLVEKMVPLRKLGYTLAFMGKDQRSFYDADLGISGTPDGLLTTPDGQYWLLEFKSIDPRANKNKLPRKKHIWQVQQNMMLVQQCLGLDLSGAVLIYIDASNVYDILEYPVQYDEETAKQSVQRANALWTTKEPDELEPEGIYNGDCDYCAFTQHCSQVVNMQNTLAKLQEMPAPFLPEGDTESLNDEQRMQVEQWIDAYDGLKQYGQQKDEVDGDVRSIVVSYNGYVQVDGRMLFSRTQAGRETVDKKLMEADGLDVSKYTKVGAPFVVLTVKDAKE